MQPQRERVKLGSDRNWWSLLLVLGALGLIGLMLVLTLMPSAVDDAQLEPSQVALLSSPTPSIQPSATLIGAPFPTIVAEPPPISDFPVRPDLIDQASARPLTVVPSNELNATELLPTIVPVVSEPTASLPAATIDAQLTPLPAPTARPTLATQSQRYAIVHNLTGQHLARIESSMWTSIAAVDAYAERFMAILPEQQTLLIPRNQQLVAIDLASRAERWRYGLLPKTMLDYTSRLTVDQAGTGVYLIEFDQQTMIWRLSHVGLADGSLLQAVQNFKLPAVDQLLLTSDGNVWFTTPETLFHYDPASRAYQEFGSLGNGAILGDGRQPLLGVFREPSKFSLIDWTTGDERSVELAAPFEGSIKASFLSNDQTILVIDSVDPPSNSQINAPEHYSAYDLHNGRLIATIEHDMFSNLYPTTIADQWLLVKPDYVRALYDISLWNLPTNSLTPVVKSGIFADIGIVWMGEVAGASLEPLGNNFHAALTPLPSPVSVYEQTALPTILPATIKPVALVFGGGGIQRLDSDQHMQPLADFVVRTFPRYNQAPLLLQRPQSRQWQLLDPITQQAVEWQFEQVISPEESNFSPLLAPDYQRLLVVVGQDLRHNDQFTGASQLVEINLQTSEWSVIADSRTWPELRWSKPIAWQGDSVYFLQADVNPQGIWRVELGPPFHAEKIVEIPSIVASDPSVHDMPIYARIYVSPNQRWLLYPMAASYKTMVLRVLDLANQQSHDIALPLIDLVNLSFAPDGNRFGLILPALNNPADRYVALYELEQQRWYQLDTGFYAHGQDQFVWSPDGHWLAVNFGYIGLERRLSIYNTLQPSLAFRSQIKHTERQLLALDNDGKTILMGQSWQPAFTQLTWSDQEWQTTWRMAPLEIYTEALRYVYPR